MITIEETIRIKTTSEAFMSFWENLEENYPSMQPKGWNILKDICIKKSGHTTQLHGISTQYECAE